MAAGADDDGVDTAGGGPAKIEFDLEVAEEFRRGQANLPEDGTEEEEQVKVLLEDAYKSVIRFLNKGKYKYIVIGGMAAGAIGEPRMTRDVDINIIMNKDEVPLLLSRAEKAGFILSRERCLETAEQMGIFQIRYNDYNIDFIIASTDLEVQAFERRKVTRMYGVRGFFPTPEDLILLKIIPGRDKDLLDAKNIVVRHKGKLDTKYLKSWAMKLCDEAENMRIWSILSNLLGEK